MAKFALKFKKKRSESASSSSSSSPRIGSNSSVFSGASSSALSSSTSTYDLSYSDSVAADQPSSSSQNELDRSDQLQNEDGAPLNKRKSFESSVDTLIMNDSASTVNTLLDQPSSSSQARRTYTGNSKILPIYSNRFKSGVQVFESDLAAKVFRTLGKSKDVNSGIPVPPALVCQTPLNYNPFTTRSIPFMTIFRHGTTVRSPDIGNFPRTLLADAVQQRRLDMGFSTDPASTVSQENGARPFCTVWQKVLNNDQIRYTMEFDSELDYAQPTVTLLNFGRERVTKTSYDNISMQWNGTTGIASPFGSGYFELRFSDGVRSAPVAIYNNIGVRTLAVTRKVGQFIIWEPGYEFADVIVAMGMVLREQEQRKEIEGHMVHSNRHADLLLTSL